MVEIEAYDLRRLLPSVEVYRLDVLACQARSAIEQSERAYEAGRDEEAGRWDALAEDLVETLESRVAALLEDLDPSEELEDPTTDPDMDPAAYLAYQYFEFVTGRSPHFQTEQEVGNSLRYYLEHWSGAPLDPSVTDEQVFDAARDAYEARFARRRRIQGR